MVTMEGYELLHENSYDYCLCNTLRVEVSQAEEALGAILYAISRNPSGFKVVVEPNIYLAKISERPQEGLPLFRIFFRLHEEKKRVDLLYVDHG